MNRMESCYLLILDVCRLAYQQDAFKYGPIHSL